MNLERLLWTKNVRPSDGTWAYMNFNIGQLFKLGWKATANKKDYFNADQLERNDLILLRQHGYVSHLVKVLNRQAEYDDLTGDFIFYRIVEIVWKIDNIIPPSENYKADKIFDFPEVLHFMGGNAMKLQDLPTFQEAWNHRGGISAFQSHVESKLELI
ncbi:hypothetical protein IQ215_06750 [Cyanobacterium stanieri LEGE 03274]|uniref:Uncharacterized protein n=1 Tax=Cyanobacterium stanieri LEGE 03274 TaxID=1828756 RepID=A0ABR9V3D1_9CHRO|nr:hypothetical protein [Cyanobacterium stanieri LEGE 03274]